MPKHSVLIVGAGISGMRAALAAHERGSDVALISKVHPLRTHGGTSQGGINAAVRDGDDVDLHGAETVKGADYLADQDAVELLTGAAPRAVIELDHWGVPFNRDPTGRLDARSLCGATRSRACFVDDMTGHAILQVLWEQVLKAAIPVYDEWVVTKPLLDDGACVGVVAIEVASGKVEAFTADAVVLATGGCARGYEPTGAAYGGTGDVVALDLRHLDGEELKRRFPFTSNIIKTQAGVDPAKDTVPVRPVAHRTMGGIQVDSDGATGVARLYASGGCADTRVHGANGLGGNWLLEALVFGERAGLAAARQEALSAKGIYTQLEDERRRIAAIVDGPGGPERAGPIRSELGRVMRRCVGPLRDASSLQEAATKIRELSARYRKVCLTSKGRRYNYELGAFLELESLLSVGEVIVAAARFREESRGAHVRRDHPVRDDARWLVHTVASLRPDGPAMTSKPVVVTKWKPEGRQY